MMDMDTTIAQMTLVDWLDDLTVRFLLNLPPAELSSVPRLCFQVEEAQWFYEDFIRPANPSLPSLNLRQFCLTLFQHCPLLSGFNAAQHLAAYEEFLAYKVRVPVRGAILMDEKMEKVLLVRGWKKGASWSFPRGKINKNEPDIDCAIREVYEETGYDAAAAGLVERNLQPDGEVKSIDVTMREQHMKLFVFRGVPLDTYFEPRTRKEIGKISWYNIRDLPGFKKQKGLAGQGTGEAQAAKFYMVAPFLGHLKRFINQQRKSSIPQHFRDVSATNDGFQSAATEDEGDTETEAAYVRSADEIKHLLAIKGSSTTMPAQQSTPDSAIPNPTSDLLAMLRGSQSSGPTHAVPLSFDPRTPFEQIDNPFPSQPPPIGQPRQQRSEMLVHQQEHNQFNPPRHQLLDQQRTASMPMPLPGNFEQRASEAFGQSLQPRFADHLSQMQYQTSQEQRQQSLPAFMPHVGPQQSSAQQRHQATLLQAFQGRPQVSTQPSQAFPSHSAHLSSPLHRPHYTDNGPSGRPVSQGVMGAQATIGSGPSAPEASKLPPPNLTAHSMKLLDAFKISNKSAESMQAVDGQKAGTSQQNALLDLFRKPSASQATASPQISQQMKPTTPASPAPTDTTITEARPRSNQRRPTFNEITRTLPLTSALKSPALSDANFPPLGPQKLVESPKQPLQILSARSRQQDQRDSASPSANVQDSSPQMAQKDRAVREARSPRNASRTKSRTRQVESPQPPPQPPVPQFSILQRPVSSSGAQTRSPVPQSPLRFDGSQPPTSLQVLKRPTTQDISRASVPGSEDSAKKDQLLSLLQKPKASPALTSAASSPPPPAQSTHEKNSNLLSLLNGQSSTPVTTAKTPEPPAAPQLLPECKPSYQTQAAQNTTAKQNSLLNLFTAARNTASVGSPGTPISPFTLGTPATAKDPQAIRSSTTTVADHLPEPRSRVGSMASAVSNGSASGQHTPTEAKDFLLGYLNGVVQKEGYRGAKKA